MSAPNSMAIRPIGDAKVNLMVGLEKDRMFPKVILNVCMIFWTSENVYLLVVDEKSGESCCCLLYLSLENEGLIHIPGHRATLLALLKITALIYTRVRKRLRQQDMPRVSNKAHTF